MYFAGDYSKFDKGDRASYQGITPVTVESVGVLGSKLSRHAFLYDVITDDGKRLKVLESGLFDIEDE